MSKHDFGYFFHEGLSNMFSHGFMSFAAIGITVACLLIMGTFTLVAVNADANLKQAERDNEILAFVDDSYTEAQAKALQKKLEAVDNVASVTFISREEAMQSFISEHPDEEYFQDLDPNILRDRFAIKVKELKLHLVEWMRETRDHLYTEYMVYYLTKNEDLALQAPGRGRVKW